MRILFVTNCLEAERDGVGDYTRNLALSCVEAGHQAAMLSLCDRFAPAPGTPDPSGLPTLRLKDALRNLSDAREVAAYFSAWKPDTVSVQVSPYGYDPRGLLARLGKLLEPLVKGCVVQTMFHEVWIGAHRDSTLKLRLIGLVQRADMGRFMKRLRPRIVHTHAAPYVGLLSRFGYPVKQLPLFGSIPILAALPTGTFVDWLRKLAVPLPADNRAGFWLGAHFGALHPQWQPAALLRTLARDAKASKRPVVLLAVGHMCGGENRWDATAAAAPEGVLLHRVGPLPAKDVAHLFGGLDFAFTTTPWNLLGKSSTVTSLAEHAVPVLVVRNDCDFGIPPPPAPGPGIQLMDTELPGILGRLKRGTARSTRVDIATRFLQDLS